MAATTYTIADVSVTGDEATPQTILYADLTDVDGVALPATLTAAPVILCTPQQDRAAYIVEKTTTYFKVALSMAGTSSATTGTFDFKIRGESV